jgi:hypothetical protein
LRCYAGRVLGKILELGVPTHVVSVTANILVKQFLVFALFQHQHVRILTQVFAEVSQIHFTAELAAFDQSDATGNRAALDRRLRESDLVINLECSRLDSDRFRERSDCRVLFHNHEIDSVANELAG